MRNAVKRINVCFLYAIVAVAVILAVFPVIYMLLASFKTNFEIMTDAASLIPKSPTFENYISAWNSKVFNVSRLVWNSLYYSVIAVIINVVCSCMAGYAFARGNFKGKNFWFAAFTSLMFINFGGATITPTLQIITRLHLNGTLWGLLVVKLFGISVINIYLVKGFISALPIEMDEAATIDGCGFYGILFNIIAPLLKPVVATLVILGFQGSWNEYLMPMIFTLSNPSRGTLVSGLFALKSSSSAAMNWNIILAGSVIASMPVVVVYFIMNKYFISGLTAGAVKG